VEPADAPQAPRAVPQPKVLANGITWALRIVLVTGYMALVFTANLPWWAVTLAFIVLLTGVEALSFRAPNRFFRLEYPGWYDPDGGDGASSAR
jgi:hypothetical protein